MSEILVISSFPDREQARQIGTILVEKQLAACVNLLPSVESIYRWEGKIERADEVFAFIKSTIARYPELEEQIRSLHPYEVPAIVHINIDGGLPDYLAWIEAACRVEMR
jgi:periplasmic divalent cation tolerance protein